MIDDTTVTLLSLKRQKIGMVHINCFQPKHMATYVVGARKPSQETHSSKESVCKDNETCAIQETCAIVLWNVNKHLNPFVNNGIGI